CTIWRRVFLNTDSQGDRAVRSGTGLLAAGSRPTASLSSGCIETTRQNFLTLGGQVNRPYHLAEKSPREIPVSGETLLRTSFPRKHSQHGVAELRYALDAFLIFAQANRARHHDGFPTHDRCRDRRRRS